MSTQSKAPVRIANASGFLGDRASALREMVEGGAVDFVTGDYLAEVTMLILGKQQAKDPAAGYAAAFLAHLEPALATALAKGIKIVVNAGGLNPAGLAKAVQVLAQRLGVLPRIATVHGDDLRARLAPLMAEGETFANLETGEPLPRDPSFVRTANAYLGAWGIVRALQADADIVICPRVTDASLVVGAAAFWHGWQRDDWHRLAGAVAAGHVIECGTQATGGNYSGFRAIEGELLHPGFPLAEIHADGSSVITKHSGTGGCVTVGTVTAQLVYEVESPRYLNPDVVTHLDTITLEQEGPDRVALRAVRGSPPPETTKVAITTRGSFRNEMILAAVGLDVEAKFSLFERGARAVLARSPAAVEFQRLGIAKPDASSQNEATAFLRVVASSENEAAVGRALSGALVELGLSSYPGLFMLAAPGAASETGGYWPAKVAQSRLEHRVTLPDGTSEAIALPPTMVATTHAAADENEDDSAGSVAFERVTVPAGATQRVPLGIIADARSGDKGSDANVGLWVHSDAAFEWLRAELTVERFRELLPEARELAVERYELPNLRALNFVVRDLLHGGAAATTRLDRQGKSLGEYLRARVLDVPVSLVGST